jgi:hypothetical protein
MQDNLTRQYEFKSGCDSFDRSSLNAKTEDKNGY